MPDINRDLLAPSVLHFRNVGNGHADATERGGTGLTDLESCGENGVRAGNRDFVVRRWLEPTKGFSDTNDLFKCRCHFPILLMKSHHAAAVAEDLYRAMDLARVDEVIE
jgi:hypothetical protein